MGLRVDACRKVYSSPRPRPKISFADHTQRCVEPGNWDHAARTSYSFAEAEGRSRARWKAGFGSEALDINNYALLGIAIRMGLTHGPAANRSFSLWPSSSSSKLPATTEETAAATTPDSVYIPDVPASTEAADILSNASSAPDAISSLLPDIATAALTSSSSSNILTSLTTLTSSSPFLPPGLYLTLLETISTSLSLPALQSIILTAVVMRVAVAPLMVVSQQELAKGAPIAAEMAILNTRMREAYTKKGISVEERNARLQAIQAEIRTLQATTGARPMRSLTAVVGQVTASIGQFVGVQALCAAGATHAALGMQLSESGVAWVPSLLEVAPGGLAAVACGLVFVQAKLGQREQPPGSPMAPMMKWFPVVMPGLTYLGITALQLPAALVLSMATFSAVHSVQSLIMQIPAVRRVLGLLPLGTAIAPAPVSPAAQGASIQTPLKSVAPKRRK
ncbi:hypothetical protein CYLTODRAFT_413722 [Cylindrobasidium torrendii FP15055 ss-10]|uniref:Uncharacterized protein n=1 Tax=Cylindrobasidium torrendii FP15055 ss-10 TaxID=1314674 RepID=A0A0D7B2W9_9AGAR|nr:hypothetical protein CYLTODRAFT_413722 [Cylindrobasidium torrendii FP15055 ss-10]